MTMRDEYKKSQIEVGPWLSQVPPPEGPQVVTFNAAMAGDWLDYRSRPGTEHQRKLSADKTNRYAEQMVNGLWRLTPQGLMLDTEGWMFNGQHRLQALRNAAQRKPGLEVDFWVFPNEPADLFSVIDTPYPRQARQLYNGKHATLVTSSVRYLMPGKVGTYGRSVTPTEVLGVLVPAWPETQTHAPAVAIAATRTRIPAAAHLAVLAQAERSIHRDRIAEWLEGVTHGINLGSGDPRRHLRERFQNVPSRQRLGVDVTYNTIVKAWNAWAEGRQLQVLVWRTPEGTIEVAGLPKEDGRG